jgi:hypothetical protein
MKLRNGDEIQQPIHEFVGGDSLRLRLEGEEQTMAEDLRGHALDVVGGDELVPVEPGAGPGAAG